MSKAEFPHESFKAAVEESRIEINEAIAARDKWWAAKGDEIFQMEPDCFGETCALQCPINKCEYVQWQQLKREVGQ